MLFFNFKSHRAKQNRVDEVGQGLFSQVANGRDAAKNGRITEQDFNNRINSMFCGGYLIGFVDEHLSKIFDGDKARSKYAARIFNGIFPGAGVEFVQSKLAARRLGEELKEAGSERYVDCMANCDQFDAGMSAARLEVSARELDANYNAHALADYLISGDIPRDLGV